VAGILVDNDIGGEFDVLMHYLTSPAWSEAWNDLALTVFSLNDFGLQPSAPDRLVWQACQQAQAILITANRNDDGPDSLEATIRDLGRADSLPVLTLADPQRVMRDKPYAKRVAEQLLEYLFDMENYRGTGRLYLP
jgi:hypothetical protein